MSLLCSSPDAWVPVTPERHANRFWRRFTDFGFVRDVRSVPLALAETGPAAAALPLVFADGPKGPEPRALLRPARDGQAALVDDDGRWRAAYVPSALRAWPFAAAPGETGDEFSLAVNESSGLLSGNPADEPFFTPDNRPSPALAQVIDFLRQREAQAARARLACKALRMAGLLMPLAPQPDMHEADCAGFQGIDADALRGLPEDQAAPLLGCGALMLAHAHLVAVHHIGWLAQLDVVAAAPPPAASAPQPAGGLSDFLDALASDAARPRGAEGA